MSKILFEIIEKNYYLTLLLEYLCAIILIIFSIYYLFKKLFLYSGDIQSIKKYLSKFENVTKSKLGKNKFIYKGKNTRAALIFHQGCFVEYEAYEPLMTAIANKGIMCILISSTLSCPFFNINDADGIKEKFPEIKNWYIGGHSLGGVISSFYLSKHLKDFNGLILLASYITKDLSKSNLKVLSIYGSNDKIINLKNYKKYKKNLPNDMVEFIIEGGNHSNFGMYGFQKGDGKASITNIEQIEITANKINEIIK